VNYDDYVASLGSNAASFGDAASRVDLAARVPSCPDWTARDLLVHMGSHHRWVRANIDRARDEGMAPPVDFEAPPGATEAVDWVREGATALAQRLADLGPDQSCWTWVDDYPTTAFWARRTANETAVHRWDMENAAGSPGPVDASLAVDGIAEHLEIARRGFLGPVPTGTGQTVHLHATDAEGEWLIRLDPDAMHVAAEHSKGDVAIRGSASDLLLVVLNRVPVSTVDVFGDDELLARWLERTRF
jgi:uncharacterized protein (TIGR03083 family)